MENFEESSKVCHKPKFPCKLFKDDHLLIDCPSIPKMLEVWSKNSHQLTIDPSTTNCLVPRKKAKVSFPCRLCEGSHQTHIFSYMDEASKSLEYLLISQQQLPTGYCILSPNLPSVEEVIDLIPSTVNLTLPLESETHIIQVDEPLVDQVINSIPHSVNPTHLLQSEINIAQVLLVTSYSRLTQG